MQWETYKYLGWYSLILTFAFIGLIVGVIVGANYFEDDLLLCVIAFVILSILIGYLLAKLLTKYAPINKVHSPSASPDLNNFQDRFVDTEKDNELLSILSQLKDAELITAFAYQYYDLLENSKTQLRNELIKRDIAKPRLKDLYERNVIEFRGYGGDCPQCGSSHFNTTPDPEKPNCLICAYNIVRDNPEIFPNKLKKLFGMYNDRRLSWAEMEMYMQKNNAHR